MPWNLCIDPLSARMASIAQSLRVALHEPNHPPRAPALNDPHIISNQPSLEAGAGGHTERLTAALVFTFGVLPVFP